MLCLVILVNALALLRRLVKLDAFAPPPASASPSPAAEQARRIAELDAWLKQGFARARERFARSKVAVGSSIGAEPSTNNTPAATPDRSPAPASDLAPTTPREQTPASARVASGAREAPEDERHELDASGPKDRRAVHGRGPTSRRMRRQRTREQTSGGADREARPRSVNQAA
jgi:hypothetical protein